MALKNESPENKNSLIQKWLSLNKTQATKTGPIRLPEGQLAPLSSGQQKLWFLQQLYPENPFYNYTEAYLFKGKLNTENLLQSFRSVISRHDILRTTIGIKDGEAVQVVDKNITVDIQYIDGQNNSSSGQADSIRTFILKEAARPFDLTKGPLTRLRLVHLADGEHLAVITMHHIITDEWSLGILRDEWAAYYKALQSGDSPQPEPLPIQYGDYAYRQKTQPTDPQHLAYWRKKLEGKLPLLNLPSDHPRPAIPSFQGGFCRQLLSADLSRQVKKLAKQTNTTMFVFLLAVYKALLYRYSGQEDILVGTPFNSRDQVSLEKLIGFFIDTLVLRTRLTARTSFSDLLTEVRQTSLEAFSHKNVPFETLVRELKPERYISTNPLFQVMFVHHKAASLPSFGPDMTFEQVRFEPASAKFDLTLHMAEENGQLSATFEYAKDLFEHTTIEHMQEHFEVLLKGIIENPTAIISDLPLLTAPESHKILTEWNNTYIPVDDNILIHQLFERCAKENPHAPGIVFQEKRLSYSELNEKSEEVAGYLLQAGVKPAGIVGLYAERSPGLIVGILGILKAGCTYLPLDPDYPSERINFMMQDAGVSAVLTHERLISHLAETKAQLLTFEGAEGRSSGATLAYPASISKNSLAYIIYTSGSTGEPKGVPITHSNLLHSTLARSHRYPEPPKSFLLLSSFAFDSSVAGIFWTLSTGGLLVLPEKRIEQDLNEVADLISTYQVTHTLLLPSLYNLLLQHARMERLASLKSVMVAGEACPPSLCALHFATMGKTELYNEYGPTEATVWCTVHQIQQEDASGPVPIGRPIPNAQIYILDARLKPVPVGVAGELYVGGSGLAQGYWRRPEFSAARFVPNPFSDDAEAKFYKTGDMARFRADGVIEFLGRADDQVKIRGYRIELSEISEKLKQLEGVKDATILLRKEPAAALVDEEGNVGAGQLASGMEELEKDKAEQLLKSVETLSESELEYMLDEIRKSSK